MLCVTSRGWGKRCIRFEGQNGSTISTATKRSHRLIMGTMLWTRHRRHFNRIFFELASNEDRREIWNKLYFQPDRTSHWPMSVETFPIDLQWRTCYVHSSPLICDWISIQLAGKKDRNKITRRELTINAGIVRP